MWIYLTLLDVLFAVTVHSLFQGTCLQKDPPPGVVVLHPGSQLDLTCSGQVKVDGVKVSITRETNTAGHAADTTATSITGPDSVGTTNLQERNVSTGYYTDSREAAVSTLTAGENLETATETDYKGVEHSSQLGHTDPEHKAPPTSPTFQPTSASRPAGAEWDWRARETDSQADYEEEEEGGRVTRGLRRRPQWKWNGKTLRKGDMMFERRGAALTLLSVGAADSGKYTCHHSGKMLSSFKVIVADRPETPVLSCYKRSPSSKIRCEWKPQQPITLQPRCYLFLSKDLSMFFSRSNCSYSVKTSRCWCALDYNEDEQRVIHTAYLCVTSAAGNVTSALLDFTPLSILTPDPPSSVTVRVDEGHERRLRVTWGFPRSWKLHDRHFKLTYQITYRPVRSLGAHGPQQEILTTQYCTITDALPGVEYVIQLRARDEYDGLWSDWSTPVYARSWTAQESAVLDDSLSTTVYPFYTDNEGSGTDDYTDVPEADDSAEGVWHHILWITGSCVLLSTVLAAYIFRHKERFVSKVQNFSIITICIEPSRPAPAPAPAPAPREAQALVTFASPRYKEPLPNQVEEEEEGEEEEEKVEERRQAMHFNNTSYFLVERNS